MVYNNGNFKAFENICTHKKGPSRLKGGKLVCQWHGAQFDPLTGKAIKGPAPAGSKLNEIKIKNVKGKLFVDV